MFHGAVTIATRTETGRDDYNQPIYAWTHTDYRAEVRPLRSDETVGSREQVKSWLRVFLPPHVDFGPTNPTEAEVTWCGQTYQVNGTVEPHMIGGRVHHYEAIVLQVQG